MARINVSVNEFRNSYKTHYKLYFHGDNKVAIRSRRLLLFYAVECGLKCLILKNIGKATFNDLDTYLRNKYGSYSGHDIKQMVKELGIDREYMIKRLSIKGEGGTIEPKQFNELWRYGVQCEDENEELKVEKTLAKLAKYIEGKV